MGSGKSVREGQFVHAKREGFEGVDELAIFRSQCSVVGEIAYGLDWCGPLCIRSVGFRTELESNRSRSVPIVDGEDVGFAVVVAHEGVEPGG
jgi:hypothetical protein